MRAVSRFVANVLVNAFRPFANREWNMSHTDPQLVSLDKAPVVLRHEGAGAGAEHRNFALDFRDVILVCLEVDLRTLVRRTISNNRPIYSERTCLMATMVLDSFSMAL